MDSKKDSHHIIDTINQLSLSISGNTSREVLDSFMLNMVKTLDSDYAFIGRLVPGFEDKIKTITVCTPSGIIDNFEYTLSNTPCKNVISKNICCFAEGVAKKFPKDKLLSEMGIEAYVGTPLLNNQEEVYGIMVVLKKTLFPLKAWLVHYFRFLHPGPPAN